MSGEKHILLVDDEVEIVDFMEKFLRRFKIGSTKVLSGEDALRVYDKDKIDFVFLDINLGGINGFAVMREMKKVNPDVKVFIIAGSSDEDSRKEARELGVTALQ